MTWIDKIRLGLVPGKVRTLYTLLLVEVRADLGTHVGDNSRDSTLYAFGREQGYRFLMRAMESRWPVLYRLHRYVLASTSG